MRLIKNAQRPGDKNTIAQVSYADSGGFGVVGASVLGNPPVFGPRGIAYRPCPGDHLILLPVEGADACLGAFNPSGGLMPGELRLSSAGGASIRLSANGDILLNGVTITKNGEILPP